MQGQYERDERARVARGEELLAEGRRLLSTDKKAAMVHFKKAVEIEFADAYGEVAVCVIQDSTSR